MTLKELWYGSEAVLFDFDGVLADSEPFYRKSWNRVLAQYGHSVPEKEYWKFWAFLGEGLEGEMTRTGLNVPSVEKAKASQKAIYREYCLSGRVPLFPLASKSVQTVMAARKCAIASNTSSDLVRAVAEREILSLPPVIGGEGLRSKPAPDIFLRAAEKLGVPPERCLVFEDAMKGIRAGTSAGMRVVLVRNRYNRELDGAGASCEITGLEVLLELAGTF